MAGLIRSLEDGVNLASNVSFEATNDLGLAHTLHGTAVHVGLSSGIMTKSHDNDPVEGGVGLTMAAAVEPMPVGLA